MKRKNEYPCIFTFLDKTDKRVVYKATYYYVEKKDDKAKPITCGKWFQLYDRNIHVKPPITIE